MKPKILKTQDKVPNNARVVDAYAGSLKELFFIRNPQWKKGMPGMEEAQATFLKTISIEPIWIFYEYEKENVVVKTVPEEIYFELRTSRNRNIITTEEQANYRNAVVGIAGLSVGSAVVASLAQSGGPKRMKIADFDELEVTNLNRLRATLLDVGQNKTDIAARGVWAIDPFAELTLFDKGLTRENIRDFLLGSVVSPQADPRLDIFIDEMDSIDLKILSRFIAREARMPVLMATDNGDSVILDVERFDLEPERALFHGAIGDVEPNDVKDLDYKAWLQLATKIVAPEYLTPTMQRSLLEIGKTIPAVPQLGTTASIAGTAMAFTVRRIANKEELPSGRYVIGCEEKLIPNYMSEESIAKREQGTKEFLATFGKGKNH